MHPELTNLLPEERIRLLRKDYFIRLLTVGVALGIILVVAMGILLLPTHLYLQQQSDTKQRQLAVVEAGLAASDEVQLEARLKALSGNAALLTTLSSTPTASAVVSTLLSVSSPGITLSGLLFTAGKGGVPGTLAVTGTADTRDHLRAYQLAILATPFAKSADLPISAYASDSNIGFTITITLAPTS